MCRHYGKSSLSGCSVQVPLLAVREVKLWYEADSDVDITPRQALRSPGAGVISEPQGSQGHAGQNRGQQLPPAGPSFTTRRSSEAHGEASMSACVTVLASRCDVPCLTGPPLDNLKP